VSVPALREQEAVALLESLQPDFLVLGGAPILPEAVLRTARIGTLNAHPGLLPRYRGVDVVAHAVLNGGPIGATVHYVDAGVDTGGVLGRVEVSPVPGDSLASLQARVETAGGVLLARVLARLVRGEEVPPEPQQERFPICRRLPASRRRDAEAILQRLSDA
jgi:methionyl-tRNA formyltransferase